MKTLLILLLLLGSTEAQHAANSDRSVCHVRPTDCQKRIIPLSPNEIEELAALKADYEAAEKTRSAAADKLNELLDKLAKGKDIPDTVVFRDKQFGSKGVIFGGTCLGKVEITQDKYILYTPADDIQSCSFGE